MYYGSRLCGFGENLSNYPRLAEACHGNHCPCRLLASTAHETCRRPAPRALHPLPAHYPMAWAKPNRIARIYGPANAAHAKYSDRLLGLESKLLAMAAG